MSLHHRMMLQRYRLGAPNDFYSQVNADPIFTPLFIAAGFTGTMTVGIFTISTATVASAIATTSLTYGAQIL